MPDTDIRTDKIALNKESGRVCVLNRKDHCFLITQMCVNIHSDIK